jgi:hypothetical protein
VVLAGFGYPYYVSWYPFVDATFSDRDRAYYRSSYSAGVVDWWLDYYQGDEHVLVEGTANLP